MSEPLVTISYKEYQKLLEAKRFYDIFDSNLSKLAILEQRNAVLLSDPFNHFGEGKLFGETSTPITPDDIDKFKEDFLDRKYVFASRDGLKEFIVKLKTDVNSVYGAPSVKIRDIKDETNE